MEDELYNQRSGTRTMPPLVRYFVSVAGTEDHSGPFTLAQLQGAWRRGTIDPQSLVWEEGTETWVPIKELQETLDPQSFDEYLASPRSGGPEKIRRRRQKHRSRSRNPSPAKMPAKKRGRSKHASQGHRNKSRRKSNAVHIALIVTILVLTMASVAGVILLVGRVL